MKCKPATYITVLLWSFLFIQNLVQAQGIKGTVSDPLGQPLPFASVSDINSGRGIVSNIEGEYVLYLSPGQHHIRVQYLGYADLDTVLQVGNSFSTFNPRLRTEVVALSEAVIASGGEDPAYTIMRRAIAKASYHSMQVDEYHAMVYLKGSGRLIKVPRLFRKKIMKELAEEGIDSTVAFTQESVSKLHYLRPDQYRDTVISIRTTGDDNNTSPMGFIYSSFYEPKVVNGISPLAPDAFNHYRFEYLGFIEDGGQTVNKIKVIPKGKGDQVFEGVIYIVDDLWSIHSLDLTTYIWGIKFDMQQQFAPVLPEVWLPVHEIYDVSGSLFGFGFEYRYFAQLKDYDIKLNKDLEVPVVVLDPKVESEAAREADERLEDANAGMTTLNPGEELSVRQLRKLMKEYEKNEIEALPESDTIQLTGASQQYIDSTAYHRDSAYWNEVRPMPLTAYEVRGYARQDSIAAMPPEPEDDPQDTISMMLGEDGFAADVKRRDHFSLAHLITGGRYKLNDKLYLELKGPLQSINFNTVDGFHAGYAIEIGNSIDQNVNWSVNPSFRYNLARESFNYEAGFRVFGNDWDLSINGGLQTKQFSYDHPISPWLNTTYTLFANRNYLKEYEQTFVHLQYDHKISGAAGFGISFEAADRSRLQNETDLVFIDDKKILYTPNDPLHAEGNANVFADHRAVVSELTFWVKPFWQYRVSRGTKRKDYSKSPLLGFEYRKGWGRENHPFDLIAANVEYKLTIGAGSLLSINASAGKFIGDYKPVYFHDFVHFPGNRLLASPINPVSSFRMLDYYLYSTNDQFASGLFNYQFRRFGLTQFEYFRRQGIRENLMYNVLLTPSSDEYMEVGYAVNYVLRFLRIEFVTAWQDLKYRDFAVRFGIATDFQSLFGF